MALRSLALSDSALETIRAGVARLAARPEYRDRGLGRAEGLDVAAPHDVYTVGLDALAAGGGLEAAEPVGRRVLLMRGADSVATAELDDPEGAGGLSANEGPFAEATARAISRVESWPEVADGDYELRVLRLPALYLMALWLKDESGDRDLSSRWTPRRRESRRVGATTRVSCSASCASGRARGSRTPTTRPADPPTDGAAGRQGSTHGRALTPATAA
jgi:hypothetical protein